MCGVCVTCLKNKTAGEHKLRCFGEISALLEKLRAHNFFNNTALFAQPSWQQHYIRGGGMRSFGNQCYATGLMSGKGEQWLTAPVWKVLGFFSFKKGCSESDDGLDDLRTEKKKN